MTFTALFSIEQGLTFTDKTERHFRNNNAVKQKSHRPAALLTRRQYNGQNAQYVVIKMPGNQTCLRISETPYNMKKNLPIHYGKVWNREHIAEIVERIVHYQHYNKKWRK